MSATEQLTPAAPHLVRSLVALITGSLLLRAAAGAMGENIQFYFNSIHEAAKSLDHPLRTIAGAQNVYEVSYTIGGLIIGTFFAAELIGAPIFGAWSDRYGRKLFIILGPLFGAIAVQLTALTTIVWVLLFTRILEGISTASNAPSTLGYIAEATAHSPKLRARVVGFFEIATIGGVALGFSLGGWLWRTFGSPAIVGGIPLTSPAFALNAFIYLASLLILWFGLSEIREVKRERTSPSNHSLQRYWKLITNKSVQSFAPAWIAINAVLGVFINLTARLLTDKNAFPNQLLVGRFDSFEAGNIRALYAVIFVVGIFVWSLAFAQMQKSVVMLIGTGGLFFTCIFLFLLNHQPSLNSPLVIPLAILLVVSIIVQSGFTPAALSYLADVTENYSEDRGAIMGLYSVFLGVGQFIGASIGGPFADWGGADGIVLVTALLGIFAAVMLVRLHRSGARAEIISVQPFESN
ncbi:MAG: MFS transporter [Chloroflexi bacterium]|nr:MFS transporter [Chloroflexota bacterium]